jgi:protein TonB
MDTSSFALRVHHDIMLGELITRRSATKALIIAILLHIVSVGACCLGTLEFPSNEEGAVTVRILKYTDLGPPPSLAPVEVPPVAVAEAKMIKPSIGIPVPVPDAEVSPEQTIATQEELSHLPSPVTEKGTSGGESLKIEQPVQEGEEIPNINAFLPVEKEPQLVKRVRPEYPELARRAGIEGTVWVKILVDKEGKARKAVVIKSNGGDMLNKAAVNAAMQFVFTPAIMNSGPVFCWVTVPFRFELTSGPNT